MRNKSDWITKFDSIDVDRFIGKVVTKDTVSIYELNEIKLEHIYMILTL